MLATDASYAACLLTYQLSAFYFQTSPESLLISTYHGHMHMQYTHTSLLLQLGKGLYEYHVQ